MSIIKTLIRTYFLDLALETAFEKVWYNFMVPEEVKKTLGALMLESLLSQHISLGYYTPPRINRKFPPIFHIEIDYSAWQKAKSKA